MSDTNPPEQDPAHPSGQQPPSGGAPYYGQQPPPSGGYGQQPPPPGGGPYYGQQPPATPPPKKRRKWPWILGIIVVLIIVIIAVSSGGGSDSNSGSGGSSANGGKASAGLNSAVRDGKFEFVVTDVKAGLTELGDNPYLKKQAQGQFVVVSMSVKNIGDQAQGFDPSAQKLYDADGRSFESDASAQLALDEGDTAIWNNINPGNSVNAKLVYDMPKDAVPTTIELHDSMFSGGAKVSLAP